jgi:hypothetical protein
VRTSMLRRIVLLAILCAVSAGAFARMYDPKTGRFVTRDTIGTWGDPTNVGNPYTYVGNNPWTWTDPYGLGPHQNWYPRSFWNLWDAGNGPNNYSDAPNTLQNQPYTKAGAVVGKIQHINAVGTAQFDAAAKTTAEFSEEMAINYAGQKATVQGVGAAVKCVKAARIMKNLEQGGAFENAALKALGLLNKKERIKVPGLGVTIPDAVSETLILEVKSGQYVANTQQIVKQAQAAKNRSITYHLVVAPQTQISDPVIDAVRRTGGTIRVFDPASGTISPYVK